VISGTRPHKINAQASHHVVAAAIVEAATGRGLKLSVPSKAREMMGSGLEGVVDGQIVRVGSHQMVHGARSSVDAPGDFGIALIGFVLLTVRRAPPLLVVIVSALGGVALALAKGTS
jgi:hypothetical protein